MTNDFILWCNKSNLNTAGETQKFQELLPVAHHNNPVTAQNEFHSFVNATDNSKYIIFGFS